MTAARHLAGQPELGLDAATASSAPAARRCADCSRAVTAATRRVCARCSERRAADRAAERDAPVALVARACRCARPAVIATGEADPSCWQCGRRPA